MRYVVAGLLVFALAMLIGRVEQDVGLMPLAPSDHVEGQPRHRGSG